MNLHITIKSFYQYEEDELTFHESNLEWVKDDEYDGIDNYSIKKHKFHKFIIEDGDKIIETIVKDILLIIVYKNGNVISKHVISQSLIDKRYSTINNKFDIKRLYVCLNGNKETLKNHNENIYLNKDEFEASLKKSTDYIE